MIRTLSLIMTLLLVQATCIYAQLVPDRNRFSTTKYAMIFGDQVQVLYDGTNLKKVNHHFSIAGDKAYYNGKYINAASRYLTATQDLTDQEPYDPDKGLVINIGSRRSAKEIAKDPLSQLTLYGRLISIDGQDLNIADAGYYTGLLSSVGMLYQTRGNFVRAEKLHTMALDLRADFFGETSEEYINSLHNLAILKKTLGEYEEAEDMFRYLLPTIKDLYSRKAPEKYAVVLNNYAMLMAELGRTKLALEQLDEALSIGKAHFSAKYIDYERMLTNKAFVLQDNSEFELASQLYQKVLKGMEQKKFQSHPDYNNVLIYYGALRVLMNEENILSFLNDAVKSTRKRYGRKHPLYAQAMTNQADYYMQQNKFELARPILDEIKKVQAEALGDKHRDYLQTLNKLGVCHWYMQDIARARQNFETSINGYLFQVNTFFNTLSETEKGNLWRTMKPAINNYMAFAIDNASQNEALLQSAYELQLRTKGLLINGTLKTRRLIAESGDSSLITTFEEYQTAKRTLAVYYSMSLEEIEEDKIDLKALEATANELERALARSTDLISEDHELVSLDAIRLALGDKEAASEIIRIPINYGPEKGLVKYGVLILKRDNSVPNLVVLDHGTDLEGRFLKFYKNAIQLRVADEQSYLNYWAPIQARLTGVDRLYLSLDGIYNNININTLKSPSDGFLLDNLDVFVLPNTKAIAAIKGENISLDPGKNAALFGSPAFGDDALIDPLPGTKIEVMAINDLLSSSQILTEMYLEDAASEPQFVQLRGPGLLHVATHGFFLPDVDMGANMVMGTNVSKARDNPLLRSGLLLSGAAEVYGENPRLNAGYNGVLNAFKVMNLNLTGTDMVIMSACETGTGEVVNGEGVYGLSRSFQVAGARKILMSLWKVDDVATKELMITFYNNWLSESDPQQAFISAQRAVKERYPDPYYWGAFVLIN